MCIYVIYSLPLTLRSLSPSLHLFLISVDVSLVLIAFAQQPREQFHDGSLEKFRALIYFNASCHTYVCYYIRRFGFCRVLCNCCHWETHTQHTALILWCIELGECYTNTNAEIFLKVWSSCSRCCFSAEFRVSFATPNKRTFGRIPSSTLHSIVFLSLSLSFSHFIWLPFFVGRFLYWIFRSKKAPDAYLRVHMAILMHPMHCTQMEIEYWLPRCIFIASNRKKTPHQPEWKRERDRMNALKEKQNERTNT